MEAKLDTLCAVNADKENRLRALEDMEAQRKGGWKVMLAVASLLGGLMGAAVSYLGALLKRP
jgi:hypothetical protein